MAAWKSADRLVGPLPAPRGHWRVRQGGLWRQGRMNEWKGGCVGVGCACGILMGWCAGVDRCLGEYQECRERKGQTGRTGHWAKRQRLATGI